MDLSSKFDNVYVCEIELKNTWVNNTVALSNMFFH